MFDSGDNHQQPFGMPFLMPMYQQGAFRPEDYVVTGGRDWEVEPVTPKGFHHHYRQLLINGIVFTGSMAFTLATCQLLPLQMPWVALSAVTIMGLSIGSVMGRRTGERMRLLMFLLLFITGILCANWNIILSALIQPGSNALVWRVGAIVGALVVPVFFYGLVRASMDRR